MAPDLYHLTMSVRAAMLTAICCVALAGCASVASDETLFFVNPARYDLYDCKQLAEVRKAQSDKVDELTRLMAKAQTATGGSVVAEIAYRPDYVTAQANLKLANRVWADNRCDSQMVSRGQRLPASSLPPNASGGRVY